MWKNIQCPVSSTEILPTLYKDSTLNKLNAPLFPYFGGKRRWANEIWDHLGNPKVYSEPFAGSLAVLLRRPGGAGKLEIITDTNSLLVNFWRAVQVDPESVSRWASTPTFQDDLNARHRWLVEWRDNGGSERVIEDADYYDAKCAGWWVWGIKRWLGPKWCPTDGIEANQVPHICDHGAPSYIRDYLTILQRRLERVVVLNRPWQSAVTDAVLQQSMESNPSVGIFMDPPYMKDTEGRKREYRYYGVNDPTDAAVTAYEWAIDNGVKYRIAYACAAGDFPVPHGWKYKTASMGGMQRKSDRDDCIMFSPACRKEKQIGLSF